MKILLLEDNISLNKAIVKVLQLDQHIVKSYFDGQEVLDTFDDTYDLYIFDINVPHINGLELLHLIYTHDNQSKVLMISSNTDINSLKAAYKLGCVDYLRKPFPLEELRIKIDRLDIPKISFSSSIKLKNHDDTLTKKEKALLDLLLDNSDIVVTYEMIDNDVYKDRAMSMDGLRALIRRLRAKLADDIINNVVDEGYTVSQSPTYINNSLEKVIQRRTLELERVNNELTLEKEALLKSSITDPLTGLYNRVKIEQCFQSEQELSAQYGSDISLIFMDLDYFKNVNDTYGHNIGDGFLKEIANIMNEIFRDSDIVGRWGGEEFLVLLPNTNLNVAQEIALRLKGRIEKTSFTTVGNRTASFGVVTLLKNESLQSLVARADEALYLAKDKGRNRVEIK